MKGNLLGIEIGRKGINAVMVKNTFKGNLLTWYGHARYPSPLEDFREDQQGEAAVSSPKNAGITSAMEALGSQTEFSSAARTAICLCPSFFSFRHTFLPFSSKARIKQVLPFELHPLLPLKDEAYESDFVVLKVFQEKGKTSLLTASIARSVLDPVIHTLDRLGIKPELVAPCGYVLANYLQTIDYFNTRDKRINHWLVIHSNEDTTGVFIGIERETASIRYFRGQMETQRMVRAVQQTITGFNQQFDCGFSPKIILVSGLGNQEHAIINQLEKSFGCRVSPIDKGRLVQVQDQDVKDQYINSVSAALQLTRSESGLNFCQGKYAAASFFTKYRKPLVMAGVWLPVVFAAFLFYIYTDISFAEKKAKALDNTAQGILKRNFPDTVKIVDPLMQMKVNVREAEKKSSRGGKQQFLNRPEYGAADILLELSTRIEKGVDIDTDRFVLNPGRIILSGTTKDFNHVDRLKKMIEGSDMFEQVHISSAAVDKTGNNVRFKFIIDI
ncbi:MAG: hypothetical protein R6U68_09350 [Desulfobacteraceae bacterium]